MQVYVNSIPIDFALESSSSEKFSSILGSIEDWLIQDNLYCLDVQVSLHEANTFQNTINYEQTFSKDIEKIEIEAGSLEVLLFQTIEILLPYLNNLIDIVIQEDFCRDSKFQESINWVCETVLFLGPYFNSNKNNGLEILENTTLSKLSALENALEHIKTYSVNKVEEKESFIYALGTIHNRVHFWFETLRFSKISYDEAKEVWDSFLLIIPDFVKQLENIAQLFTVGNEFQAFQKLVIVWTYINQSLILLSRFHPEEKQIGDVIKVLSQMTELLVKRDFLTAADIIDFDLKGFFENLSDVKF